MFVHVCVCNLNACLCAVGRELLMRSGETAGGGGEFWLWLRCICWVASGLAWPAGVQTASLVDMTVGAVCLAGSSEEGRQKG